MQVCDVLVNLKLFVLHQLALKENMLLFSIVLSALVSQNYIYAIVRMKTTETKNYLISRA